LTPGLSAQGSSGTFEDKVAGSISCDGPLLGITPTGPGTVYDKGNYGTEDPDSCFGGGEGVGSYTLVFPTAGGPEETVAPFTVTFGDPATNGEGLVTVKLEGEGWHGDLAATPTKGDCFSAGTWITYSARLDTSLILPDDRPGTGLSLRRRSEAQRHEPRCACRTHRRRGRASTPAEPPPVLLGAFNLHLTAINTVISSGVRNMCSLEWRRAR
jgi:hypothetical protein